MITTEPSSRAVLVHRLMTVLAAVGLIAGAGWIALQGPLADSIDTEPAAPTTEAVETTNASDTQLTIDSTAGEPVLDIADQAVTAVDDDTETGSDPEDSGDLTGTRFVDLATTRVLDTRTAGESAPPVEAGESVEVDIDQFLPGGGVRMVVLSVNVAMAQGPGPITVAAGGGPVTAINVVAAGQMTTNMVFVPYIAGEPVAVTTAGGGHLVVDLVGYFEEADVATAGRFVPVATQRLARLVTEVDGREAVVNPLSNPALPASGVTSVVVRITADVGEEGGMVRLGQDLETLPNTMMWAATSGDDRTRQGVAVVPLSEVDELAFVYTGGSVLDLDALGYFTDDTALEGESGIFVPSADTTPVTIDVAASEPTTVDIADLLGAPPAEVGSVVVNTFAAAETAGDLYVQAPGQSDPSSPTVELGAGTSRFGFTITEVDEDGSIIVSSDVDTDVTLVVPGFFKR